MKAGLEVSRNFMNCFGGFLHVAPIFLILFIFRMIHVVNSFKFQAFGAEVDEEANGQIVSLAIVHCLSKMCIFKSNFGFQFQHDPPYTKKIRTAHSNFK